MLRPVHLLMFLVAVVAVAYADEMGPADAGPPKHAPAPLQEDDRDDLAADASGWGYSKPYYGRYSGGGWQGGWNRGGGGGWNKGWGWGGQRYGGYGRGYSGGWW